MEQADYLNFLARKSLTNYLSREELKTKHTFRERLQSVARQIMTQSVQPDVDLTTAQVNLESYGSLSNSFGTAGCDVDLMLTVRTKTTGYLPIPYEYQRLFEEALLDQGIGARLLTNTYVPILQVCEKPNEELLKNLRAHRAQWEATEREPETAEGLDTSYDGLPLLTKEQEKQAAIALAELDNTACDVPLPEVPATENSRVEFVGDCGILCDVNFTRHVALYNTKLLWTYGQIDHRVRPLIIFVKNWAKAREVNTPYQGTLSSYGWVMLGLHYLINIANPPVLPNLQQMAKDESWSSEPIELYEGYDVRFMQNPERIRQAMDNIPRNKESLGGLLQGFFRYYAHHSGFKWTQDVISIRTPGGLLSKQAKGWTALRRSEDRQNVRHRYLLAIEDPFELEHNIGRTVGHNGVVAIREEFRRAWQMIESIHKAQSGQASWEWASQDGSMSGNGLDLIAPAEKRGDLLRKDQEARRQRLVEMRKSAEAGELAAKENLQSVIDDEELARNGMLTDEEPLDAHAALAEDTSQLIHDVQHQDEKVSRMRGGKPSRQRLHYEDDDEKPTDKALIPNGNDLSSAEAAGTDETWLHSDTSITQTMLNAIPQSTQSKREAAVRHENWELPVSSEALSTLSGDERCVSEQGGQGSHTQQPTSSSSRVGPYIPWSSNSEAGRWLLDRDKRIRAKTFKPDTCGEKGRLHSMFPYDPDMTVDELRTKNERLETFYKNSLHPRLPPSAGLPTDRVSSSDQWIGQKKDCTPGEGLHQNRALSDWLVGPEIHWSQDTAVGRWLQRRDKKIRDGIWKPSMINSRGLFGKLNACFPYEFAYTMANIDRMNVELATYFTDIEVPHPFMRKVKANACRTALSTAIRETLENRLRCIPLTETATEGNNGQTYKNIYRPEATPKKPDIGRSHHDDGNHNNHKPASTEIHGTPKSTHPGTTRWTDECEVGIWLQRRDEMVSRGIWKEAIAEGSIFGYINKLYPYTNEVSAAEQDSINEEIKTFFMGLPLPHPGYDRYTEPLYRAVLEVMEQRKENTPQAQRKDSTPQVLLDLFKNSNVAQEAPNTLLIRSQYAKTEQASDENMNIVRNLSQGLSPVRHDATDFVRQQRLAFFARHDKSSVRKAIGSGSEESESHGREDSGVEGSWNQQSPSCHCSDSDSFEHFTDQPKPLGASPGDVEPFGDQHDPATTDESEVVPNTLRPDTWRKEFPDRRDQDPRIMPIPRTFDFRFDLRQMADIETIRAGGNGCARGGLEFSLESDQYSWGGGGAMGQKSHNWSWGSASKQEHGSWRPGDGGDPVLMKELPGLCDMDA